MGIVTAMLAKARRAGPAQTQDAASASAIMTRSRRVGKTNVAMYRNWAEHGPFVRTAIDIRKGQLERAQFDLVPYDLDARPPDKGLMARQMEVLTSPNPGDSSFGTLISAVAEDVLALDAGAIEKERTLRGEIRWIWPTDGGLVKVDKFWQGDPRDPRYYWAKSTTEDTPLLNDDLIYTMIHNRSYSPVGLSYLEILKDAIDAELVGSLVNSRAVTQSVPDGIMDLGENARPDQVEAFKCFADDTDFLTSSGWRRYDEVTAEDRLGVIDDVGELHFEGFTDRFAAPYTGQMIRVSGQRGVDLLVTPNHRMVLTGTNGRNMRFVDARDLLDRVNIPVAPREWNCAVAAPVVLPDAARRDNARWPNRGKVPRSIPPVPMQVWLEFIGYLVSEGYVQEADVKPYAVGITQNVGPSAERIQACLDRLPISSSRFERDGKINWRIFSKSLWQWAVENVGVGAHNKRFPREYLDLDREHLQILFDALMLGDGRLSGESSWTYTTVSTALADLVQELGLRLGRRSIIRRAHNSKGQEWMNVHLPNRRVALRQKVDRVPDWSGRVVCFTVPSGRLVVRRNGQPAICGNSFFLAEQTGGLNGSISFWGGTKGAKFINLRQTNDEMQYMDWLRYNAIKVAAVFQISVQDLQLLHDVNKATGQVQQQNTEDRGFKTLASRVQDTFTAQFCWDPYWGGRKNNIAFRFRTVGDRASQTLADVQKIALAGMPSMSINEARQDLGLPPIGNPRDETNPFNKLMANTPVGLVLLDAIPTAQDYLDARGAAGAPSAPPSGDEQAREAQAKAVQQLERDLDSIQRADLRVQSQRDQSAAAMGRVAEALVEGQRMQHDSMLQMAGVLASRPVEVKTSLEPGAVQVHVDAPVIPPPQVILQGRGRVVRETTFDTDEQGRITGKRETETEE